MVKAMVFAAGIGSRLRPLTDKCPKPLIPIGGQPVIWYTLERLRSAGIYDVVVNVHHLADMLETWLADYCRQSNMRIAISDERALLLDTGGGLKAARPYLQQCEAVVVCNADIITTLDIEELIAEHQLMGGLATLAVRNRPSSRQLIVDNQDRLVGWQNNKTGETKTARQSRFNKQVAFSGTQVIDPKMLDLVPEGHVFSIIDWYLSLAATHDIYTWAHDHDDWLDMGSPESLTEAEHMVARWKL
jgi:NDP-sugar pyrophosphorylase family protein